MATAAAQPVISNNLFPNCQLAALVLTMACALSSQNALAQDKVALVIGNSDYLVAPLVNSVNDAQDIKELLDELGFNVIHKRNVRHQEMEQAVITFAEQLKPGTVGLFYYAGHGVQVEGENYLLPVAHGIQAENEVKYKAMNSTQILGAMEQAKNRLNIVIMDACRNNPFQGKFRSVSKGLARMESPLGSIIAYATAPGSVAADGAGRNGVYTKHLLSAMRTPGLTIEDVFKQVRNGVMSETAGQQVPWEESSLLENFYFQGQQKASYVSPEMMEWQVIQHSEVPEDLSAFIDKYPDGAFTVYARNRLERLKAKSSMIESLELNDWRKNSDSPSTYGLKNFLRKYPEGKYTTAARDLLGELEAKSNEKSEAAKKKAKPAADRKYPELVSIPAGCFEDNCVDGFKLGRYEVTVGQFKRFVDDTGYVTDTEDGANGKNGCVGYSNGKMNWQAQLTWRFPGFAQAPDEPVVCLSLSDVEEYLDWLGSKTNGNYRLPTNDEWEIAARGRETADNFWQQRNSNACQFANIADNNTIAREYFKCNDQHAHTAPVGTYQPNVFGAYDMLGNVWEWTSTVLDASVTWAERKHVSRGGSWVNGPKRVGFSGRAKVPVYIRTNYLGFRVAQNL